MLRDSFSQDVVDEPVEVHNGVLVDEDFQILKLLLEVVSASVIADELNLLLVLWTLPWQVIVLNQIFKPHLGIFLHSFLYFHVH